MNLPYDSSQGPPPHFLHGKEEALVWEPTEFMDRNNTRMLELRRDLGFFDEPRDDGSLLKILFMGHLHDHDALEIEIQDTSHFAHGARADGPEIPIPRPLLVFREEFIELRILSDVV